MVTFQSRFGKAEWLKPYTEPTLRALAKARRRPGRRLLPGLRRRLPGDARGDRPGGARRVPRGRRQGVRLHPLPQRPARVDRRAGRDRRSATCRAGRRRRRPTRRSRSARSARPRRRAALTSPRAPSGRLRLRAQLQEARQHEHRDHDDQQQADEPGRCRNTVQRPSPIDSALRICASASGPRIMPTTTGAVGKSKRRITRRAGRSRRAAPGRTPTGACRRRRRWRRSGCRRRAAACGILSSLTHMPDQRQVEHQQHHVADVQRGDQRPDQRRRCLSNSCGPG